MSIKRRRNPASVVEAHPLNALEWLEIRMHWEDESRAWVTVIPHLGHLSTFGDTEQEALDNTAEMLLAWVESSEANGLKIPLTRTQLKELKRELAEWA